MFVYTWQAGEVVALFKRPRLNFFADGLVGRDSQ